MKTLNPRIRPTLGMIIAASIAGVPMVLAACEKSETVESNKTTKTTETPNSVKTTTETTETKVETQKKP